MTHLPVYQKIAWLFQAVHKAHLLETNQQVIQNSQMVDSRVDTSVVNIMSKFI